MHRQLLEHFKPSNGLIQKSSIYQLHIYLNTICARPPGLMRCTCLLRSLNLMAVSLVSEQNKRIPDSMLLSRLSSNSHRCRLSHRSAFQQGLRWFLSSPHTLLEESQAQSWSLQALPGSLLCLQAESSR